MYSKEEKVIILGALFHDIGKFVQRCVPRKLETHQKEGAKLVEDFKRELIKIFNDDETSFENFKKIILNHHNSNPDDLTKIVQKSDRISASERVDLEKQEEPSDQWQHKHLCSLMSKISILKNNSETELRYYKHQKLTKELYNVIIPESEKESAKQHQYGNETLVGFNADLKVILENFSDDSNFDSLIDMLLILFEKYMWCIPDFTGSSSTDISLYNHLKDVCALSHSVFKADDKESLALIVGDLPGIQNYIFNINNRKAAKLLRGRSILIQVLTRNIATLFLRRFGLTEANIIMLAGGKFYILVPNNSDFDESFNATVNEIQNFFFNQFQLELSFNAGKTFFKASELIKSKTIGDLIEVANQDLLNNKNRLFKEQFEKSNFILGDYIDSDGVSENVKCYLTDKPILKGFEVDEKIGNEHKKIYKSVKWELAIGEKIVHDNIFIPFESDGLTLCGDRIKKLKEFKPLETDFKILLNPDLDELLKKENHKDLVLKLTNTKFLEVANFVSRYGKEDEAKAKEKKTNEETDFPIVAGNVMDFKTMAGYSEGAKFLTLIKGDIDNLGLIMAYGLDKGNEEDRDLRGLSRTTTLSYHLRYFFSYFFNGFLKSKSYYDKEGKVVKENSNAEDRDNLYYTVFAGGDDLMIVCPQSEALSIVNRLNEEFNDFSCHNNEIHITYSITHFKPSTPIKMVSDISEGNQEKAKSDNEKAKIFEGKSIKEKLENQNYFDSKNNKSATRIFESIIDNENLDELMNMTNNFMEWSRREKETGMTMGVIRNTLNFSEMMKAYSENGDTKNLIWHPLLTYMINRLLKDKVDYKNADVGMLYKSILSLNKEDKDLTVEKLLNPAISGAIYKLRG